MEPPLFHDNCAYATSLFAGYGTKTTEKRQNQPQMSRIKTDLKPRIEADVLNTQRLEGSRFVRLQFYRMAGRRLPDAAQD
jgi:hypothetical protein